MIEMPIFLFDIDGVLVDVRDSYHQVIVRTVIFYLRDILGLLVPDDLVTTEHVAAAKRMGGFNNDWNTVAAILSVILAEFPQAPTVDTPTIADVQRAARALRQVSDGEERLRRGARRFLEMEDTVHARGGGLATVQREVGYRNAHLLLYGSWDPHTDLIVRIYQELYLGPDLFGEVYNLRAQYYHGPGLINRDRRIISYETLDALAQAHRLGLVTGRPRVEAEYTLRHLGLWDYFQVLVSHDEVVAEMARRGTTESLSKPHPWPLTSAANTLDPGGRMGVAYIGDTVDDVRAAVALRVWRPTLAIGCTYVHDAPEAAADHLRAAGADLIVHHPDELVPSGVRTPDTPTRDLHR